MTDKERLKLARQKLDDELQGWREDIGAGIKRMRDARVKTQQFFDSIREESARKNDTSATKEPQ